MPTVPRVTRQVSPIALPGARLTAAETALSSGAGVHAANADAALREGQGRQQVWGAVAGLGQQIQRTGGAIGEIVMAERLRADQVAVMESSNKLSTATTPLLYDPKTGALAKKGKDALGTPEQTMGEFNKIASEIESTLTTERQKRAFAAERANRAAQLDLTLRRHVLGQMEAYEAGELTSSRDNHVAAAIAFGGQMGAEASTGDPMMQWAQDEIQAAVLEIKNSGPRLGMGPATVANEVLKTQTAAHVGIVEQLISQDKIGAAKAYFEEARDAGQIAGPAQARVVKALEEGTVRKESQTEFDRITDTLPEEEWVKAARDLKDKPEVRDAVEARIQNQLQVNERARREEHEQLVINAKNIIDKGGVKDFTKLPGWSEMTVGESGALRNYGESKVTQVAIKTNPAAYHFLTTMANSDDPAQREAFVKLPMMKFVDQLSTSDWQQMVDAQQRVRKGDATAAHALLVDVTTQNKMVDEALLGMGMDPSPKQPGVKGYDQAAVDLTNQFRRTVREEVAAVESRTGKKATDEQVQKIVDTLRTPTGSKMTHDGWFRDTYRTAYAFEGLSKATTIADVPADQRALIEAALRKQQKVVNDSTILGLYLQGQQGKK